MCDSLLSSIYNINMMFDSKNYKKQWYEDNRETVLKKARYYRENNKEQIAKIKHFYGERSGLN